MNIRHLRHLQGPIARGTLRTSTVLGTRLLAQAGTLLLVARILGPRQFGAFAGVAALAVILGTLASFGTNVVLLGEVSKDPTRRADVLPYALPCTVLCGVVLLAIYIVVCTLVLGNAGISITVLVALGVAETLLQPLLILASSEHLGLGRIARSQMLAILPLALRLAAAATVFLFVPDDPLTAYGYGYFMASLIALAIAVATLPAPWPATGTWRLPHRTEWRNAAGYAALNVTAVSPTELDKTLAAKLLPLAAGGLYAASARVIGAATLPVIAMLLAALPRLFREGHGQPQRTSHLLRWIFAAAFGYSVALAVILWFIAPAFAWIFGPKYQGIEHVIHWLTLAVPGMALRIAAGSVLMALGRPWMRLGYEAAGLLILTIASISLVRGLGPVGMPVALACSECFMACAGLSLVKYIGPIKSTTPPRPA